MAHLLNGCKETFGNFYSKRHIRISNYLYDQLRTINDHFRTYNNKLMLTIFAELLGVSLASTARKPDIVPVDVIGKIINTIKVTVYSEAATRGVL